MRLIKFSWAKIFVFSLLAVFIISASLTLFSSAREEKVTVQARLAPLNPEFIKFREERKMGLPWPERTAEGHILGAIPTPIDFSYLRTEPEAGIADQAYPSTYSLLGKLPDARNQGNYGTCWAFASYGSLEPGFGPTALPAAGNFWDFSERHLAENHGFDYKVNDGGHFLMSTAYLARWAGPVKESDVPYWSTPPIGGAAIQKHVQNVYYYPARSSSTDNNTIKSVLTKYKVPIYASMYFADGCYNSATAAFYNSGLQQGSHAVAIVGWDDNYSAANFAPRGGGDKATPPGNGAFLVRNSWGADWGQNGYFWASYYDSYFAKVSSNAVFTGEATSNYKTKYEYDPLGWTTNLGFIVNGQKLDYGWFANIFKATSNASLTAVSFYATAFSNTYEVYVYTKVDANKPRSGNQAVKKTGKINSYAGYVTIPIGKVPLTKGDLFAVVVKLRAIGNYYPVPLEATEQGYSSKAKASNGQSFYSYNGTSWTDCNTYFKSNVCAKGFGK